MQGLHDCCIVTMQDQEPPSRVVQCEDNSSGLGTSALMLTTNRCITRPLSDGQPTIPKACQTKTWFSLPSVTPLLLSLESWPPRPPAATSGTSLIRRPHQQVTAVPQENEGGVMSRPDPSCDLSLHLVAVVNSAVNRSVYESPCWPQVSESTLNERREY